MEIVKRHEWGATEPRQRYTISTPVSSNYLHHTGTNSKYYFGAAGMRNIQRDHKNQGWYDIGYSWVYDPKSRIWFEGRGFGVSGSHTKGYNSISHGFCVMGNYQNATLGDPNLDDIGRFVADAHKAGHGPAEFTGGHRDVGATSCPGDWLYTRISNINTRITDYVNKEDNVVEKYDETSNPAFQEAYNKLVDAGVFSEYTEPTDPVTAETLAVFLDRAERRGFFDRHAHGYAKKDHGHDVASGPTVDDVVDELVRRLQS